MCTSTCVLHPPFGRSSLAALASLALLSVAPVQADRYSVGRPEASETAVAELDAGPDLSAYRILSVSDLSAGPELRNAKQVGATTELPDRLLAALEASAQLGLELRRGEPLGRSDELVLGGTVQAARHGRRITRYLVGPLGRARLVVDLELRNGASGALEAEGTVKKLWAFPGWLGATRGFGSLLDGTCKEVVSYLEESLPTPGRQVASVPPPEPSETTRIARAR